MEEEIKSENKNLEVVYHSEKDFYKAAGGQLRFKAEGLFKKAKEKGISIEEVNVEILKNNHAEFPGIGVIDLPAFIVKVKGKHLQSGQVIIDGKQLDYYNRYQKYMAEKIENKNHMKDENGKIIKSNNRPKLREGIEFKIEEWEKFEIGKSLIEDKEYGLEKTITGGCDRVIRKLMGENDWLNPGEAKLLEEEFNEVQNKIASDQENKKSISSQNSKKATERQINYLKARMKNLGLDPEDKNVMEEVIRSAGFENLNLNKLNTTDMSKIIEGVNALAPKIKESLDTNRRVDLIKNEERYGVDENVKQ